MNTPAVRHKCFACDRKLGNAGRRHLVDTHDDQLVYVGSECFKLVENAGDDGYQPPKGGPRLWILTQERLAYFKAKDLL